MRNTIYQHKERDLVALRENESAYEQHKLDRGVLKDHSLQHRVEMRWNLSDEAKLDMIFELVIDGETRVLLDWEEMLRLGRWV